MASPSSSDRFVADTHALWWYLKEPTQLSAAAADCFRMVAAGAATLIVPTMVVAEVYYVSVKLRQPLPPAELFGMLTGVGNVESPDLGMAQLELLPELTEIPEMHDRLIAADALIHDAPVVTRDRLIAASPRVETVW